MNERPEPPPEGRLIALAQKRARLSGRKSASRAGMSEGHWRAIVTGARSIASGTWVPVRAPAETLARMARVVGVTPEQLDEAGRPDAAEELRAIDGPPTGETFDEVMDDAERMLAAVAEKLLRPGIEERKRRRREAAIEIIRQELEDSTESNSSA